MTEDSTSSRSTRNWILLIVGIVGAVMAVIFISRNKAAVEDFVRMLGVAGPLLMITLYVLLALSPAPADALAIITGSVFQPLLAIAIVLTGSVLAAYVEYYIGQQMRDASEFDKLREKLPFKLGDLPVESPIFLIGGRMLTSMGSKAVSYLSGIYQVGLWRFTWTTAIAASVGATLYVLGGFGLLQIF